MTSTAGIAPEIVRRYTERRLVLATAITLTVALAASASVADATTHPAVAAATPGSDSFWTQLASSQTPAQLPARGAGAAITPAADPAAAKAPSAAKLTGAGSIPATALAAYRKAAASLAVTDPSCHLTWPMLAGIGKVESDNGLTWGSAARITVSGDVVPAILGPVLDGTNGTEKILDTDGGALDGDRQYDRAVGPMQFLPSTWKELGRDGNGDGIKDPNNLWDAALATGGYLCDGGRDLSVLAQEKAAIFSYNPSNAYVASVLAWAAAYQKAGANLPSLLSVPDPLVLGAGGELGEDPFGDGSAGYDDGSMGSDSYDGPTGSSAAGTLSPTASASASRAVGNHFSTPAPSGTVSATPTHQSPSPTPSSMTTADGIPVTTPSTSSGPSASPSPSPTPSLTPSPSPTPPMTTNACDPGITAAGPVAAVPVDWNSDGSNDVLRVTVPVLSPVAGSYTVGVRLSDGSGYRITSTVATVAVSNGSQNLVLDLSGPDIGDAGASGPMTVRVTVRDEGAAATCDTAIVNGAGVGNVDASTFAGWDTSLARLQARLSADISAGSVSGGAATSLPAALSGPAPDLTSFRFALMTAQFVSDQERTRLDSLAARLMAQPGESSANPTSYTDDIDPGSDGVG